MIEQVIKKDGSEQPFNDTKLRMSIQEAARDASLPEEEALNLVESVHSSVMSELNDRRQVSTEDLRELILDELDERRPEVADAWREYEEEESEVDTDEI